MGNSQKLWGTIPKTREKQVLEKSAKLSSSFGEFSKTLRNHAKVDKQKIGEISKTIEQISKKQANIEKKKVLEKSPKLTKTTLKISVRKVFFGKKTAENAYF